MPKTILLLNWRDIRNPLAGGAEVHIWETFGRFSSNWQVYAVCSGYPGAPRDEQVGNIQVLRCGGNYSYPWHLATSYRKLAATIRPDVVVDFLNKLPLMTPLFVRGKLVCFVHHLFGEAAALEANRLAAGALRVAERLIPAFYRSTEFIVGSESTGVEVAKLGIDRSRIHFVPYGVDLCKYSPGAKSPEPELLYLGRVKRYKGIDDLLTILPNLLMTWPNLRVVVAGAGDYLETLKRRVAELNLDTHVTFLGHVSEREKVELYRKAWLLFFLSAKEGYGLTVAESALCGTPTVAYDVPGLRDAICDGQTGALVPYKDLQALEKKIRELIGSSVVRGSLSVNAYYRFKDLSWERTSVETERLIEQLL